MSDLVSRRYFSICLLFALLIPNLIIVKEHFPYLGFAVSLFALTTLVYALKKEKNKIDSALFITSSLFCLLLIFRANEGLTFFTIVTLFYLGTLISMPHEYRDRSGFLQFAFSPLFLLFESVKTKNLFPFSTLKLNNSQETKSNSIYSVKSILLTALLLLIIVPLLSSVNPIFEKLITNLVSLFRLQSVVDFLASGLLIPRVLFFAGMIFLLPRVASFVFSEKSLGTISDQNISFSLILPKIVVSVVLAIFFATQAQLYFSDIETLRALDYTYSEYAREVFGQLIVVSGIIIALLYNDKSRTTSSKLLTYILVFEGVFLTLMALKSVYDYSNQWGFTEARLWGYTGVAWMITVFGLYIYTYIKNRKNTSFVQSVIATSLLTLLAVNLINFDYLIYHNRKSVTERGVDYEYLSRLSSDSQSYHEQLSLVVSTINPDIDDETYYLNSPIAYNLLWKIEKLQEKYSSPDIRTFNFSEYNQYQELKEINVEEQIKKLDEISSFRTPPIYPY